MLLPSGCQQKELEIYNETFQTNCTDDRNEQTTSPFLFNPCYLHSDLWLDPVTLKRDKRVHSSYNFMSSLIFPIKAWKLW